ncbi:hypothetical protein [Thaumasiovibrio sp. DFM-14]|uniref:hypothetical protein n=1 Tax=Thaumasiovibrio sp. DFM-14 TaxID=3384792 RepID=UPI00399FB21E
MSKSVALNEHIYNLLIVRDLDHFTVTGLRDALLEAGCIQGDKNEARKFAYRQISRLLLNGYLKKSDKKGVHNAVYSKTPKAHTAQFYPKKMPPLKNSVSSHTPVDKGNSDFLKTLQKERNELEALQAIALREIEKYQEVIQRFPSERPYINTIFVRARVHATNIQGDLEALAKLVDNYPLRQGDHACA